MKTKHLLNILLLGLFISNSTKSIYAQRVINGSFANNKLTWASAINTTSNNLRSENYCINVSCTSPGGGGVSCTSSVCNPDKAMCLLTTNAEVARLVDSNDVDFENSSAVVFAKYISKNTTGDGDLEVYETCIGGGITTYKAYCKGDCDKLFRQIVQGIDLINGYIVSPFAAISNCSTLPALPLNIKYIDVSSGNIPLLEYNHTDINSPATLKDVSKGSDHEGVFTTCFSLDGPNDGEENESSSFNPTPVQAAPGNGGTPAITPPGPPDSGSGNDDDNVIIEENESWFTSGTAETSLSNALNAIVYPNPADKDLFIELASQSNTMASISIKDINGKELITGEQKLQMGNNRIAVDVAKLKAGFYFINITANNQSSVLKITIQ